MYVKLFNQILDSSLADNRKLRHFFTDLLLCSDADGNVLMTKTAISNRIRASMDEVNWGICELEKPDPLSNTPEYDGRRIIPLEGHGYGWKIVNFEHYRDMKSERQRREETANRVRIHREKKKLESSEKRKSKKLAGDTGQVSAAYRENERRFVEAENAGDQSKADSIAAERTKT